MRAIEDDTGSRTQTTLETTLVWNKLDKGVNLLSDTGAFRGPRAGNMWVGPADRHGDHDPYAAPVRGRLSGVCGACLYLRMAWV